MTIVSPPRSCNLGDLVLICGHGASFGAFRRDLKITCPLVMKRPSLHEASHPFASEVL